MKIPGAGMKVAIPGGVHWIALSRRQFNERLGVPVWTHCLGATVLVDGIHYAMEQLRSVLSLVEDERAWEIGEEFEWVRQRAFAILRTFERAVVETISELLLQERGLSRRPRSRDANNWNRPKGDMTAIAVASVRSP